MDSVWVPGSSLRASMPALLQCLSAKQSDINRLSGEHTYEMGTGAGREPLSVQMCLDALRILNTLSQLMPELVCAPFVCVCERERESVLCVWRESVVCV